MLLLLKMHLRRLNKLILVTFGLFLLKLGTSGSAETGYQNLVTLGPAVETIHHKDMTIRRLPKGLPIHS